MIWNCKLEMQSLKGLAHVAGFQGEEDPQAAGECQHGRRKVDRSSTARGSAAREATSMIAPQGSTIRRAATQSAVGCRNITSAKADV